MAPTEATNTKLMDTSPGGENTQYEGAEVFQNQVPKAEHTGSKSDKTTDAQKQAQEEKAARGEKTAENIRYGEAISEHGFGGETVGNSGGVESAGGGEKSTDEARGVSGYKKDDSGVGA